jgi:hypothetical protein
MLHLLHYLADVSAPNIKALPRVNADSGTISTITTIIFTIVGAMCLLIVTVAGFRYVISRGDPGAVAKAKGTIIYALIGLAVTISAAAIVNFVLGNL